VRRLLIVFGLAIPALVLIGWLIAAQLPRWTAPQANWFVPNTPGVCAAVDSLVLYGATRANVGGIGRDVAILDAAQVVQTHYEFGTAALPSSRSEPLGVQATLPGDLPRTYYVITMALSDDPLPKAAVIYLDAATGDPRALIMGIADPAANCDLDVKAALLAAAKSPPLILLVIYGVIAAGAFVVGWLLKRRGIHR
jgi:hypothetical protein